MNDADRPTAAEITQAVREFVLSRFLPDEDPDNLTLDTPLITSGVLDSISTIELIAFLEQQYMVKFAAHEVTTENLDSLDIIARVTRQKIQGLNSS